MSFLKRNPALVACGALIVLLAACVPSLASDITPPPNSESYTAQTTPALTESIYPLVPPDPAAGKAIFTEKCAPCHGDLGLGDGPQSSNLPIPVPALGDPALAASARPVDWYNMVTNGNLERYMPGFSSLDDRQRWDVVSYALSLSLANVDTTGGKTVYDANCASCHGAAGQGSTSAANWQKEAGRLAQLSLDEISTVSENGKGDMPGFGGALSSAELQSVARYVRQISFAAASTVNAVATAAPTAATPNSTDTGPGGLTTSVPAGNAETLPPPNLPDTQSTAAGTPQAAVPTEITVNGKITAPDGVTIPTGLKVTLAGFDSMSQAYQAQTSVNADGTFTFDRVEFVKDRAFIATFDYNGTTFSSEVFHGTDVKASTPVEMSIGYYETTSDISGLRAERLHLFFDFTRTEVVQVVELFILNNTGDKAIVSADGKGSVSFDLPEGATNLQFQDSTLGERYIQTDKGFADSASILPGDATQILFAYDLPYNRKANIKIPLPMPVDAAVVMVPQGNIKLTSDQLQSTGARDVQGVSLEMFSASGLAAGTNLDITLSGKAAASTTVETGSSTGLLIGGGVLGLVLIGAGVWMWRQRKQTAEFTEEDEIPAEESRESVMDAIIALDDAYQAGNLPQEAYQQRRAELKEKLQGLKK